MKINNLYQGAHISNDNGAEQQRKESLYDFRFRSLLARGDWNALPKLVQKRFSKRLHNGQVALYHGTISETRFNTIGWCLAQILRLIAAPLPLKNDVGTPAVVVVAEDPIEGGQIWTRTYHNRVGFPQTINSAKRFAGKTGLEEHIGFGVGMALKVDVIHNGLRFTSDHYFWSLGRYRIKLPQWICPGKTEVCHIDKGDGAFDFTLKLHHPLMGELLYQKVRFHDG